MARSKIIDGKKFFLKNESTDLSLIKNEQTRLLALGKAIKIEREGKKWLIWFRSKESRLLIIPRQAIGIVDSLEHDIKQNNKQDWMAWVPGKTFKYRKDKDILIRLGELYEKTDYLLKTLMKRVKKSAK